LRTEPVTAGTRTEWLSRVEVHAGHTLSRNRIGRRANRSSESAHQFFITVRIIETRCTGFDNIRVVFGSVLLGLAIAQAAASQNPSPMSDSTRPHVRVEKYEPPGRRATLSIGTLYIPPSFDGSKPFPLIVHFHGAPWLLEHHVRTRLPRAALVSVQIGSGSRVYGDAFAEPERFTSLLSEIEGKLAELAGRPAKWTSVALTSFSAGYGAIRAILKQPENLARVDAVVLADSLHASYAGDGAAPRTTDLSVDESSLEPFVAFAAEAAAGRKQMFVTHSEIYPGTYASTTETADVLLRRLGLRRRAVLKAGPVGMQQLSEASRRQFHLSGYAGNSAPDHMDHLYGLGDLYAKLRAR
jgi:hypothetical protein